MPPPDTFAYRIRDSLYLNLTNRCFIDCVFCGKHTDFAVRGHQLELEREPTFEQAAAAIESEPRTYSEIVFCGYGEPLVRPDLVRKLARWIRRNRPGIRIRLNTDGTAEFMTGEPILETFKGLLDSVSVSLNAADGRTYARICRSKQGAETWDHVIEFVRKAKEFVPEVVATAVELPGLDMEPIRKICREDLGVPFRPRPYNEVG